MSTDEITFVVSESDSERFAALSGDFNPLHVDAIAARRLQFGGTVCHGIHLVMKSMDLIAARGLLDPLCLVSVAAVFNGPVRTGHQVRLLATPGEGGRLRLAGSANGRSLFTATLMCDASDQGTTLPDLADAGAPESAATPRAPEFPSDGSANAMTGHVPVKLHDAGFRALFPTLSGHQGARALQADLMATTRIVGMECPGMHSIYAELRLKRRASQASRPAPTMNWRIDKVDPRFKKVRLAVEGLALVGTLDAFFRAPQVTQRSLAELCTQVPASRFSSQCALVVGGSRGLGELVAKLILAGNGRVLLTYARGRDDAERVCAEAKAAGADCKCMQLDVSHPLPPETLRQLADEGITHLYHFATPQITKGVPGGWNQALFDTYSSMYVHALGELVKATAATRDSPTPLQVFYPSTVFLDRAEKGFAEYCAAKAAGEVLCDHLNLAGGVMVHRQRLPRLRTDQNSGFLGSEAGDPMPVMYAMLQLLDKPSERTTG